MRRLALLGLGLTLVAPAAARAGEPGQSPLQRLNAKQPAMARTLSAGALCNKCAAKLPRRVQVDGPGTPPPLVFQGSPEDLAAAAAGGCIACQSAAHGGAITMSGQPIDAPGYASIGGQDAPGYASVGGALSAEPAPIGVMRTDFSPHAMNPAMDPMHGARSAVGPHAGFGGGYGPAPAAAHDPSAMGGMPPYATSPFGPTGDPKTGRKFLGHLLGMPKFRPLGAKAEERRREAHAQISYGPNGGPDSLPASMVYGRR